MAGRTKSIGDEHSITVSITLRGEESLRLQMWADQNGMSKNLAAKRMLIEGMIEKGLLLKSHLKIS